MKKKKKERAAVAFFNKKPGKGYLLYNPFSPVPTGLEGKKKKKKRETHPL